MPKMDRKRKFVDVSSPHSHCCNGCPEATQGCSKGIPETMGPSKKVFTRIKDGIESHLFFAIPLSWNSKNPEEIQKNHAQNLGKEKIDDEITGNSLRKPRFLSRAKICTTISAYLRPQGFSKSLTLHEFNGKGLISKKTPLFTRKATMGAEKMSKTSCKEKDNEQSVGNSKQVSRKWQQNELNYLKPLFFEVSGGGSPFVGREWVFEEVEKALETSNVIGIIGSIGTGKTSLVLQIVEKSCFGRVSILPDFKNDNSSIWLKSLAQKLVAFHFCQMEVHTTCLVPEFIHSLAAQLSQAPQFSAYKEFLINQTQEDRCLSMTHCLQNSSQAFVNGILTPLSTLHTAKKIHKGPFLIIIDALDSVKGHRVDTYETISTFLCHHLYLFPSWLKLIVTVDTTQEDLIPHRSSYKLRLDGITTPSTNNDILTYINFRAQNSNSLSRFLTTKNELSQFEFFSNYFIQLCRGSFLFIKLLLDLIETGAIVTNNSYSLMGLPTKLSALFYIFTKTKLEEGGTSFDLGSPILSTCLAAKSPLTLLEIYHSLNSLGTSTTISWESFVDNFKVLSDLLPQRSDGTHTFFHPAYRHWLVHRDDGENIDFLCDTRLGHSAIFFRLLRVETLLSSDKIFDLGHHFLKARLYRKNDAEDTQLLGRRDTYGFCLIQSGVDICSALTSEMNIYRPNVKVSRLFLSAGANPNQDTRMYHSAPLIVAYAANSQNTMVSLLLDFGANVNAVNGIGETALHFAASTGNETLAKMLLERGATLDHINTNGLKCMDKAIQYGHIPIIKLFLKRGAKLGLVTWDLVAGKSEMTIILLNKLLSDGNTLMKKFKLSEASHRFLYALQKLRTPKYAAGIENTLVQNLKFTFLLQLCRCERKLENFEKAIVYADEAILVEPTSSQAYYGRARIHQALKRTTMALEDLHRAIEFSSSHSHSYSYNSESKKLFRLKEELSRELRSGSQELSHRNTLSLHPYFLQKF